MSDENHPLNISLREAIKGNHDLSESILKSFEDQNHPGVIFNKGWHCMRKGKLSEGLRLMDAGRFINCFGLPRIEGTIWKDQPLENKTLLFRCEGGFGDQILNFRFAYDFQKKGARVVVSCASDLKEIFNRHGFICVDNEYVSALHYDYWVPAMSAAHILGYEYDTLSGKPYLKASYRKNLYSKPSTLKVGIRWSGRPEFEHEQHRRFDPTELLNLHKIEKVTLYSLQRDENTIDGLPFADLRSIMTDWEETSAIIEDLDLVISSCTSVAHLSASMGKETWIIVPALPYYTWAMPGDKSAWYESVRLFRQISYGDWSTPLNEVKEALLKKVGNL